jgi:RNA polymerase sigma-70 factor (ECF subfamily)
METPEKTLAWLFRTTTYRCTDHLRKTSRRRRRETGSANSARVDTPADTLDEKERQAAILEAVDSLPAKFRLVVMLKYFAQFSYADISEMTGLTKGAIDGRLRSATKKLRDHLLRMGIGVS